MNISVKKKLETIKTPTQIFFTMTQGMTLLNNRARFYKTRDFKTCKTYKKCSKKK